MLAAKKYFVPIEILGKKAERFSIPILSLYDRSKRILQTSAKLSIKNRA